MKTVFVVWHDNGETWEDHCRGIEKIFLDGDKAADFVDKENLQCLCKQYLTNHMNAMLELEYGYDIIEELNNIQESYCWEGWEEWGYYILEEWEIEE